MVLNLKNKILLILLFYLITLAAISLLGYSYSQELEGKSRTIEEDNYKSIQYASSMQVHLNQIHQFQIQSILAKSEQGSKLFKPSKAYQKDIINFEGELRAAEKNITETAEASLVKEIRATYGAYLKAFREVFNASTESATLEENITMSGKSFFPRYQELRQKIQLLHDLNMEAIVNKTISIREDGNKLRFYLALFGMISIIVTLVFIFILPGYLANPIIELNRKIQDITDQNYEEKLELKYHSRDEVGELATSFNSMASRIKHYEESSLLQVWLEKRRTEMVIENLPSAIIVLDENQKMLYANQLAQKLMAIPQEKWMDLHASKAMDEGDNIQTILNSLMISDVADSHNEKRSDTIKLQVEEKEAVFKRDTIDMHSMTEEGEESSELIGSLIILERVFA